MHCLELTFCSIDSNIICVLFNLTIFSFACHLSVLSRVPTSTFIRYPPSTTTSQVTQRRPCTGALSTDDNITTIRAAHSTVLLYRSLFKCTFQLNEYMVFFFTSLSLFLSLSLSFYLLLFALFSVSFCINTKNQNLTIRPYNVYRVTIMQLINKKFNL